MNRRLRTDLPTVSSQLKRSVPDMVKIQEKEIAARRRREDNFDHIHRAKSLEPLMPGDSVWMTDRREDGVVTEQVAPRSYSVATPVGEFRRNRRHLNLLPDSGAQISGRTISNGISDEVIASVYFEKSHLKKMIMIIIMNLSQEMTVFGGCQKLTSAMKQRPESDGRLQS